MYEERGSEMWLEKALRWGDKEILVAVCCYNPADTLERFHISSIPNPSVAVPYQHSNEVFTQKKELLRKYRFLSLSSGRRKGSLSRQAPKFCRFFEMVPPLHLESQGKWHHWSCSALQSGFQIRLLGGILCFGDRVAIVNLLRHKKGHLKKPFLTLATKLLKTMP